MIIFDHFPETKICPWCGTNEDKATTLIDIDGTSDEHICEAIAVHVSCITSGELRYNQGLKIFYRRYL